MNDPEEKDDTIRRMLRKIPQHQNIEYPEPLLKRRRNTFIRWIFSRQFGCLIFWVIMIGLVLVYLLQNLP